MRNSLSRLCLVNASSLGWPRRGRKCLSAAAVGTPQRIMRKIEGFSHGKRKQERKPVRGFLRAPDTLIVVTQRGVLHGHLIDI
jgi:hypothetical protein